MARPTMAASASGVLKQRSEPNSALQPRRSFEHAALALDFGQASLAAAIGDVLAKDDDARVAAHLFRQGQVDLIDHGARLALQARRSRERAGSRIDAIRVQAQQRGKRAPVAGRATVLGGLLDLDFDFVNDNLQGNGGPARPRDQLLGKLRMGSRAPRRRARPGSCTALVVGKRMGIGADDLGANQGWAMARAAPVHPPPHGLQGSGEIRAVHFFTCRLGNAPTSAAINCPPAVCFSTGTEMA